MFEPKATAPHLDSTKMRNTLCEQMFSASPPNSDIARCGRHFAFGPIPDLRRACPSWAFPLEMIPARPRLWGSRASTPVRLAVPPVGADRRARHREGRLGLTAKRLAIRMKKAGP